jgi:hypothetical protein
MHENREICSVPSPLGEGRSAKASCRTADMHVLEKTDCAVIPVNRPNKGGQLPAEAGEGRAQLEENIVQAHMFLTLSRNQHVPAFGRCACSSLSHGLAVTPCILQKGRMRRRARTDPSGGAQ